MKFADLPRKPNIQIKADIEFWKYVGAVMKVIDKLMLSLVCDFTRSGLKRFSNMLESIHEEFRDFRYNDVEDAMCRHICHETLHVSPEYLHIIGGGIGDDDKDDPNVQWTLDDEGYLNIRIKRYNFLKEEKVSSEKIND